MVGSTGLVHICSVLLTEVLVEVLQVAEGQFGRVGCLTQGQIAYTLLQDVTVRKNSEKKKINQQFARWL